MISVQTVIERLESVLDAEGSDRYTFVRDFKPAINSSVEFLQAIFNKAFAEKKLSEEDLKELVKVVVFQTNQFSRINLDQMNDSIWSLLRVNPEPVLTPLNPTITPSSSPADSLWRQDLSYVKSKYSCKLLSLEQWEENVDNIFEAGNERLLNSFKSYAYLNFASYASSAYNVPNPEIEIRPEVINGFVSVTYLKYPTLVTAETDLIELPKSLTNLVWEKAANIISYKQGDQTNLYTVTREDINILVGQMK
jgi:hypothetical protein